MNILIFNCGSSSLSYKIYQSVEADKLETLAAGKAHRVGVTGTEAAFIEHRWAGQTQKLIEPIANHREAAGLVFDFIRAEGIPIDIIGHRFIHGGRLFQQTTLLTDENIKLLDQCAPLAPIHNPNSFSVIQVSRAAMPDTPQYIALDSAFHAGMPDFAHHYALPQKFVDEYDFRKYGFHGLSYQDVCQKASDFLDRPLAELRLVACHLGTGGSSVTAIKNGLSLDTSMGYSPLPGLMMSTRAGDIDPTLVLHLIDRFGYSPAEVNRILNKESGLLGVSGLSSDIRDLINVMPENPRAQLAFSMYTHRLKQYIGGMIAVLGGLDALIFTDDVGLYCPEVRAAACANMAWCGITLDEARNRQASGQTIARINADDSGVAALVIPNDEEMVIGREGQQLAQTLLL
jgi:acetate kinase